MTKPATDTLSPERLTRLAQFAGWNKHGAIHNAPYYPTNLNACLELILAMRREGFVTIMENRLDTLWEVNLVKAGSTLETDTYFTVQNSLPAAICAAVDKYMDSKGKPFGYVCSVCGYGILDNQPNTHTDYGLAHTKCVDSKEGK